jgi:hypothetical protein
MNFFNKINDFLFPKKEPIQFPLTDREAENLLFDLRTNGRDEYIIGYLFGYYLSDCNKNEIVQKYKTLREAIIKLQEKENSLMGNNGKEI